MAPSVLSPPSKEEQPIATSASALQPMSASGRNNTPTMTLTLQQPQPSQASPPATTPATSTSTNTSTSTSTAVPLSTRLVLSAVAGMGAATVCHPLDVIRVQMQTSTHYKTSWQAARGIYQQAGLTGGLYAGISAAYLRQWMYGSFRMGVYSYLLDQQKAANTAAGKSPLDISLGTKLAMGAVAGSIGSFVGTPSEVALVRMSADSNLPLAERRNYANVVDCLVRIAREEGVVHLWRGATPTVLRATALGSVLMGVTSETKGRLIASEYFGENGQWLGGYPMMLCATLVSSFAANIVANPFDVIKSRMQNMPIAADGTPLYRSLADCLVTSVRHEGPLVLYSGFFPAFIKLAPYAIISLTLAEKLTKAATGQDAL